MKRLLILAFLFAGLTEFLHAQSLQVGFNPLEEYHRVQQLIGKGDSSISYTVRPLSLRSFKNSFYPDTAEYSKRGRFVEAYWENKKQQEKSLLLPIVWQQQYNSHHPYGWNDNSMAPAAGYQTLISGGFYSEFKNISIQIRPEVVIAQNKWFEGMPIDHHDEVWRKYYNHYNFIDLPEKLNSKSYVRFMPGQSAIRYHFNNFSSGISSENLWWGPGVRNSLLMSNTAPGFVHFTFNTDAPVHTRIGSFEGQLVIGRLDESGSTPPHPERAYLGTPLYVPKPDDWRYFSGLVLTYQPKWVKGLFLGTTRSMQLYSKDLGNSIGDYLPLFGPIERRSPAERKREELSSIFMRWAMPEAMGEIYFEYGRNQHNTDLTDVFQRPEYSRAYLMGFKKLVPLKRRTDEYLQLHLELTQMQQQQAEIVRAGGSWYLNEHVRHGYTQLGEVIGAGVGPGANLQSFEISWLKGLKHIGLQLERYTHNNDLYFYTFENTKDFRTYWVDLSAAVDGTWNYKNFLFNAKLSTIRSLNYTWWLRQTDPAVYFVNGRDRTNFHAQVGMMYRF